VLFPWLSAACISFGGYQTESEAVMRKNSARKNACVLSLIMVSMALPAVPAAAQTDSKAVLAQDFKAFDERCKAVTSQSPPPLSQSCANELAELTRRQRSLHLTDADLEAAGVRGGFRGEVQNGVSDFACSKVPQFMPWPPPRATSSYSFPNNFLRKFQTLGEFNDALQLTLNAAGYYGFSYFHTPGGYALATPIEKIDSNGYPANGGSRWKDPTSASMPTGFLDFLTKILYDQEGDFRVFVFIITNDTSQNSSQTATFEDARRWAEAGCRGLPTYVRDMKIDRNEIAYALTYVFSATKGKNPKQIDSFNATTAEQFARAGIKF
jgi:hypothetical protein